MTDTKKPGDDLRREAGAAEMERTRDSVDVDQAFARALLENAAEGICVCHAIEEHPFVRFTVWNPRMAAITGYSMEEINRLGWYQTMYPDPETRKRARERMAAMRVGDDLKYERWEVTRADGEHRVLGISTSLVADEDGGTHVLALMQDVTTEERYRKRLEGRLETLEGLLPICSSCKMIRDEGGGWKPLEQFITERSDAMITHGFCPSCFEVYSPSNGAGEGS